MMKIQREVRKNLLPLLHKQTYRADTGKQFIQKDKKNLSSYISCKEGLI